MTVTTDTGKATCDRLIARIARRRKAKRSTSDLQYRLVAARTRQIKGELRQERRGKA